jgi:hypothetical protein
LSRLDELIARVGAPQLHGTLIVLPPDTMKDSVVLVGQIVSGIVTYTGVFWSPANVPFEGLNWTEQHPPTLAKVSQFSGAEPGPSRDSVSLQLQPSDP